MSLSLRITPRGVFQSPTEILRHLYRMKPVSPSLRGTAMRNRPFSSSIRPTTYTRITELRLPSRNACRRFNSSRPSSNQRAGPSSQEQPLSFSQRMRKLSREYGWSALGVYLLLSALDFPFCFAAVRLLGVDRIGHWEHTILESAKRVLDSVLPFSLSAQKEEEVQVEGEGEGSTATQAGEASSQDPRENASEEASIWTQVALAYALHKSLIFFRVPLTAAITPNVVKTLRRWGWDIGKRRPKGV